MFPHRAATKFPPLSKETYKYRRQLAYHITTSSFAEVFYTINQRPHSFLYCSGFLSSTAFEYVLLYFHMQVQSGSTYMEQEVQFDAFEKKSQPVQLVSSLITIIGGQADTDAASSMSEEQGELHLEDKH